MLLKGVYNKLSMKELTEALVECDKAIKEKKVPKGGRKKKSPMKTVQGAEDVSEDEEEEVEVEVLEVEGAE